MEELSELAASCGYDPVNRITQNLPWEDRATCVGPGKVDEIRRFADAEEAEILIFNNTLSPAQIANLTKAFDLEVMDRTGVILQIFALHASSREARIQVEYARLKYMLPRLVGLRRNLSRQGGGSGSLSNRGSGEMQIELDRRHIERRMSVLRKELASVAGSREVQRKRRERNHFPLVSLVGYTNAGKSSLMNALLDLAEADPADWSSERVLPGKTSGGEPSGEKTAGTLPGNAADSAWENSKKVFTQDMVFATLDTTVRRISPPGRQEFLLSDTVGFISDLPTALVEAFHSTLEEVLHADLILEVVDASDPEHDMHMEVTAKTLQELGAGEIPMIRVMNKTDLLPDPDSDSKSSRPDRIYVSAERGTGLDGLMERTGEKRGGETIEVQLLIPFQSLAAAEQIRAHARILNEEYTPEGLNLTALINMDLLRRYRDFVR